MTESEWLTADDMLEMLDYANTVGSNRKLRLFACACCRRFDHLLTTTAARRALDLSEQAADGAARFADVAFDRRWRTEAVVGLALSAYTELAFDRLPILADALEEAGCADPAVLSHCRGDGFHVRGCWVVDLVLGRK